MITFIVALASGMFVYENADFFQTMKENRADGMKWEYVGKTEHVDDAPAIPLQTKDGEVIYWKMK